MTLKWRLVQIGIVLGLLLWLAVGVAQAQAAIVRVDPETQSIALSSTGTVTIMIDDAMDLGGFQFDMTYDATLIQVDSVTLGSFLGSTGRTVFPLGPTIDNVDGRVVFGGASFGMQPGPTSTGELATVTFHTLNTPGASRLDLENVQVLDTNSIPQDVSIVHGGVNTGSTAVVVEGLTAQEGTGETVELFMVGGLVGLTAAGVGAWGVWQHGRQQ